MSDYKSDYSNNSNNYIKNVISNSHVDQRYYTISKNREKKWNDEWNKRKVNINDIVGQFAPNSNAYINGYKYIFNGDRYQVVSDMVAGYLRIIDKRTNQPVKLDGKPGSKNETHFKIKKREEM